MALFGRLTTYDVAVGCRRVSVDTSSATLLLGMGIHPRETSVLALLRETARRGEQSERSMLEISAALGGSMDLASLPGQPRETNALSVAAPCDSQQDAGSGPVHRSQSHPLPAPPGTLPPVCRPKDDRHMLERDTQSTRQQSVPPRRGSVLLAWREDGPRARLRATVEAPPAAAHAPAAPQSSIMELAAKLSLMHTPGSPLRQWPEGTLPAERAVRGPRPQRLQTRSSSMPVEGSESLEWSTAEEVGAPAAVMTIRPSAAQQWLMLHSRPTLHLQRTSSGGECDNMESIMHWMNHGS